MLIAALTSNREIMEANFKPYILDVISMVFKIIIDLLDQHSPDSRVVSLITLANTLKILTFGIHISQKSDKCNLELYKLDPKVYTLLLENIFVKLNTEEMT